MNVSFRSITKQETEVTVVVDGKEVGRVIEHTDTPGSRYHACLRLEGYYSLIQGFGSTMEEAIDDAIRAGRDAANNSLRNIDALEKLLRAEASATAVVDAGGRVTP